MIPSLRHLTALLVLLSTALPLSAAESPSLINWIDDEKQAFALAKQQDKPVLLYLEAVWCHWCHVIDRETYGNTEVAELVSSQFIPLRVDHDNRPDLANRYRDYGWPATIFFTSDGIDMVKRQGYIAPEPMIRLLRAIIEDPSPEAAAALDIPDEFAISSSLDAALEETLMSRHLRTFDAELGGLTINQKFLDRDTVELDMMLAADGDEVAGRRARKTLDAALALIDPAWGGVYQYSTHADWEHPHFEKLGTNQGDYLRIYALAWGRFRDPAYLEAANAIVRYIDNFLTDENGAFYTSQDADLIQGEKGASYFALDDTARRVQGIPRIDTHQYARENGRMIEGLATLYEFTRDEAVLTRAVRAARWIIDNRSIEGGGFRHDATDPAGPYLGDSLAMGRACLALYKVTSDRTWFDCAVDAAKFIDARFRNEAAGYLAGAPESAVIQPVPHLDENLSVVRFVNLLNQISGMDEFRNMANHTMRYLATPAIATSRVTEAGILIADRELNTDPLHLTVVGSRQDDTARDLFQTMLDQPGWYKRAEWWDKSEGNLPNPDVTYPSLSRTAGYVCTDNRCSAPLVNPEALLRFLERSGELDG